MTKFNPNNFKFDCTGDVCQGDTICFEEAVFHGSFRSPQFAGMRKVYGIVKKDSYGEKTQQHTFTIEVIHCEGVDARDVLDKTTIRRKGRNVYKHGTHRTAWKDESQRKNSLNEKHARGDAARAERYARLESRF